MMIKNNGIFENFGENRRKAKAQETILCKCKENYKPREKGITMIALIVSIGLIIVFVGTVIACIKANWHEQRALDGAIDTIDNYIDSTIEYNQNDIENSINSIEE